MDDAKEMEEGQEGSAPKETSTTLDRRALDACSALERRHCGILSLLHHFSLFCLLPGLEGARVSSPVDVRTLVFASAAEALISVRSTLCFPVHSISGICGNTYLTKSNAQL